MEERPFRYISLFSGVEAMSVAWHPLGWEPVAFAELDKLPSAVLAHHYPDVPNVGDVTKHDWTQYEGELELVVGGSPCQSLLRRRKATRNGRSSRNLALEYLRVIRDVKPTCSSTKMSPVSCHLGEDGTLVPSSGKWKTRVSGISTESWTRVTSSPPTTPSCLRCWTWLRRSEPCRSGIT